MGQNEELDPADRAGPVGPPGRLERLGAACRQPDRITPRAAAANALQEVVGAIGGMLLSGIIGLFVGAVVLAIGYKMALAWMAQPAP